MTWCPAVLHSVLQVKSNVVGIAVAAIAVLSSSLYQVWAGSKQKELSVNGNQLLHQVGTQSGAHRPGCCSA